MQREAKDVYTGVVPYLYRVLRRRLRRRRRRRYQRAEVEEEERCGLINGRLRDVEEGQVLTRRRFRVVGNAVMISRRWKNIMSGDMV